MNSANFKTRDEATRNLHRVGEPALRSLREALSKADNLEYRRRIEALIASIEQAVQADDLGAMAPCLLGLRALEMLERIGSAEARRLVETVVASGNNGVLGHEARLILARWQPSSNAIPLKE